MFMGYKNRDIELVWLSSEQCLVVACDSCGGVGEKESDALKVDPVRVAQLITRNAMLEVMAVGAQVNIVTATIANETEPTGRLLIDGIRNELEEAHLGHVPIVISTEKHFKTVQTSFGITVVASAMRDDLRVDCPSSGDYVYCLGAPQIGEEIIATPDEIMIQSEHVKKLLQLPGVHDIIPVGSRGIAGEVHALAQAIGLRVEFEPSCILALNKPAGPCSCLLFTCSEQFDYNLDKNMIVSNVGRLIH